MVKLDKRKMIIGKDDRLGACEIDFLLCELCVGIPENHEKTV